MPQASPGDFCLGNLMLMTTSPMHWMTSASDIDEPSSRHTRTSPAFVMTKRIFTSPEVDGSRFSPARKHACALPCTGRVPRSTSLGVIWCEAIHGSSPPAALKSGVEDDGACVEADPVVGPAPASGSPADADAAVVSLGGACSADLGALLPTASSLSFAGGVPPPQATSSDAAATLTAAQARR